MVRATPWLIALLFVVVGCTEDEPPTPPIVQPSNNTNRDMAEMTPPVDMMQEDATADMDEGDTGDPGDMPPSGDVGERDLSDCRGEGCTFEWSQFGSCTQVLDVGTFDVDNPQPRVLYGNTSGLDSITATSCSANGNDASEFVFAFKASKTAFVSLRLNEVARIDWVTSMREGTCETSEERTCADSGQDFFVARADTQYFLLVEPNQGTTQGDFELELTFQPLVCEPIGGTSCAADDVVVCEGGREEKPYACGSGCEAGACNGDTCDNAITLTQPGTYEYEGTLFGYSNAFNARDHASCSLGDTVSTPGAEQIFKLEGLTRGQTVQINADDVTDRNDNVIFIARSCGAAVECLEIKDLADNLTWLVPEDGDYVVIIDGLLELSSEYKHVIEIQ